MWRWCLLRRLSSNIDSAGPSTTAETKSIIRDHVDGDGDEQKPCIIMSSPPQLTLIKFR